MTIGSLTPIRQATGVREGFTTSDVRTVIANYLGVAVERVTDQAHFVYDLGAGWLDRLELMIVIEDQFADVEITDEDFRPDRCRRRPHPPHRKRPQGAAETPCRRGGAAG